MNPSFPTFKFALSPDEPALTPESERWSAPLPSSRHGLGSPDGALSSDSAMTYGDYFTAVQHFLSRDDFSLLCEAAGHMTGDLVTPAEIDHISVFLVKFGAFYHPSYVVVGGAVGLPFVLNVAVSPEGRKMMAREYRNLSRLNAGFTASYWPRVFGMGQGDDPNGHPVPMFLGQWFEGYYEFHLTGEDSNSRRVVLWDTDGGHRILNHAQVSAGLEQAACILTHAYNPLTFEAIGNWHHAAGDFVMALDAGEIVLRLITVRKYAPIIENPQPDVASILDALLFFWVGISLRLRLDRLDGIGRMVCHRQDVIPAICRGFLRGLRMSAPLSGLPGDFDATVKEYAALHGADQLMPMVSAIIENSAFNSEEKDLLRRISGSHISTFIKALSN